jgi:hypothetical protein
VVVERRVQGRQVRCLLPGLFVIHYLVALLHPPYGVCMREFDRQRTWMKAILVRYVVGKVVSPFFFYQVI